MATHCFIPLLGKRIRVTPLDSCGNIPAEAEYVATDGFVTVTLSSEVEEGTEIIVRKASGALCVNEKMADSFKRFTVEIDFCGVNPSLLAIVSNAVPYEDATGDVVGFTVPEGEIAKWFSLELWTGLSGAVCEPGAEEASGYMLLPLVVAGVLGDIEIGGEDAITFSLTGAATKGGNNWGVGRYNVVRTEGGVAAPLPVAIDPFDHLLLIDTSLAPPPEACDPVAVPALPGGGGA
ncbi:major tail protein [Microbacterium phage Terij]|uniref:Major tail protein n=1 Tax=Microbacterium phage Terij TaxID=2686229 RepID=A0A6B9L6T9_9CAUD|nr:major tail protein [Microbacterium phage Terij]QHB37160.1 major tail protein [Microbacterium phage Terij]